MWYRLLAGFKYQATTMATLTLLDTLLKVVLLVIDSVKTWFPLAFELDQFKLLTFLFLVAYSITAH